MRKVIPIITSILLIYLSVPTFAQQEAQFTQYMFNGLFYNPALAGQNERADFSFIHRTQWAGFSTSFDGAGGGPQTQVLNASTPFPFLGKSGAGLTLVRDQLGPITNLEAHISLANHIEIGGNQNSRLSVGLRGSLYSQTLDGTRYRPVDAGDAVIDQLIAAGVQTETKPDMAAGIVYSNDKWFAGVSMTRLLGAKFNFGLPSDVNYDGALASNLYISAGYKYAINPVWVLQPFLLYKMVPEVDFSEGLSAASLEISALVTYDERFWGGLGYRQGESASVLLGMYLTKDNRLRLGYGFDYVVSGKQGKAPTSHEILLSYGLPLKIRDKAIQDTPRYKH